jgi:hypothetical protein
MRVQTHASVFHHPRARGQPLFPSPITRTRGVAPAHVMPSLVRGG